MDVPAINEAIKACLAEICGRLDEATRLARAAEACVLAGSIAEGVEVSMDIEQLMYEAGRLHEAVCLMLSLIPTGEPDGHHQNEFQIRQDRPQKRICDKTVFEEALAR